jgi:hypothetical protein
MFQIKEEQVPISFFSCVLLAQLDIYTDMNVDNRNLKERVCMHFHCIK